MTYGYARCSTNETKQDINRQVRELKTAGADTLFLEYEHGDSKIKSQQEAMFAQAQAGTGGGYHPHIGGSPAGTKHPATMRNH